MNPPLRFGRGDALDAVHARLEREFAPDPLATHAGHRVAQAPGVGFGRRVEHFEGPPAPGRVTLVHVEEVGGPQCGLVAAGPCADLEHDRGDAGIVRAHQACQQCVEGLGGEGIDPGEFLAGQGTQLVVRRHGTQVRGFALEAFEGAVSLDHIGQRRALDREITDSLVIAQYARVFELRGQSTVLIVKCAELGRRSLGEAGEIRVLFRRAGHVQAYPRKNAVRLPA